MNTKNVNRFLLLILISIGIRGSASASGLGFRMGRLDTSKFPEVLIYLNAVDGAGNVIGDLKISDFNVTEDGAAIPGAELVPMHADNRNLAVVLALDRSGSMKGVPLEKARKAAVEFLQRLNPKDSVAVVAFDHEVAPLQLLMTDKQLAETAINGLAIGGDTALYDAAFKAVEMLGSTGERKVVILLTDGKNDMEKHQQTTHKTMPEAIAFAKSQQIPIYTIGLGNQVDETVLKQMAADTGGLYLPAPNPDELSSAYHTLADKLVNQYVIKYRNPREALGAWHALAIELNYGGDKANVGRKYFAVREHAEISEEDVDAILGKQALQEKMPLIILISVGSLLVILIVVFLLLLLRRRRLIAACAKQDEPAAKDEMEENQDESAE